MPYDYYFLFAMIITLCAGSFLNVIIHRLPIMINDMWESPTSENQAYNIAWPSSHCPHCKHNLAWYDNIPILSWLLLRGQCRYCKHPISYRYISVEILATLWGAFCWTYSTSYIGFALITIMGLICIAATFIDFEHFLLPDDLVYPLLWLGIVANLNGYGFASISHAIYGAIVGYLSLWTLAKTYEHYAKKEAMGYGDFKMLAAIGAWLGIKALPLTLMVACAFTLILAFFFRAREDHAIPFGPGLCFSAFMLVIYYKVFGM